MKRTDTVIIFLLIVILLLIGYLVFFKNTNQPRSFLNNSNFYPTSQNPQDSGLIKGNTHQKTDTKVASTSVTPVAVRNKYEEVKQQYANSLGARLQKCVKGKETVYVVSGSGGYTGISYYYNSKGVLLDSQESSDVGGENKTSQIAIEVQSYSCENLEDFQQ